MALCSLMVWWTPFCQFSDKVAMIFPELSVCLFWVHQAQQKREREVLVSAYIHKEHRPWPGTRPP